jgi:YggT family protein
VPSVLGAFDAVLSILRVAFFALAVILAVVSTIDWLVRTRRLNPFGPVARFFRQTVDPVFAPVERQLVRAGGTPAAAPWWTLAVVIVAGIIGLNLLEFIRSQVLGAVFAAQSGPMGFVRLVIGWTFGILQLSLLVRVISSWIRVSPYSRWVRWAYTLSEPMLRPLRGIIPSLGMIDITPIVAFFALSLLQSLLLRVI